MSRMQTGQPDLIATIRKIIAVTTTNPDAATIGSDADLFGAGILDSFGVLEVLVELENHFGITFSDHDLVPQNFWSLSALAGTIRQVVGE